VWFMFTYRIESIVWRKALSDKQWWLIVWCGMITLPQGTPIKGVTCRVNYFFFLTCVHTFFKHVPCIRSGRVGWQFFLSQLFFKYIFWKAAESIWLLEFFSSYIFFFLFFLFLFMASIYNDMIMRECPKQLSSCLPIL